MSLLERFRYLARLDLDPVDLAGEVAWQLLDVAELETQRDLNTALTLLASTSVGSADVLRLVNSLLCSMDPNEMELVAEDTLAHLWSCPYHYRWAPLASSESVIDVSGGDRVELCSFRILPDELLQLHARVSGLHITPIGGKVLIVDGARWIPRAAQLAPSLVSLNATV